MNNEQNKKMVEADVGRTISDSHLRMIALDHAVKGNIGAPQERVLQAADAYLKFLKGEA